MTSRLRDAPGFLRFVLRRWTEDRCPQVAGSLTFTTLLALAPIFAIVVALLSSSPLFESVLAQLKAFILMYLVPEIAGRIISEYMPQLAQNAGRLTTVGVSLLFVTAVALMLTIDRSFNAIWRVRRARPYWITVLGYFTLLAVGPFLIGVSVSVSTYLIGVSAGARLPEIASPALLHVVPVIFSALAFLLLYRVVPHRRVPWRHAFIGGSVTAILFEAAKELFAVYVRYATTYNAIYGAFAALPFFLLWIYLSWLVILFGAELTAALDYWKSGHWIHHGKPDARFGYAVAVARRLFEARGAPVSFEQLRLDSGMPQDQLEDALQHMTASGLVERVGRDGYAIREREAPEPPKARRKFTTRKARREKGKKDATADERR